MTRSITLYCPLFLGIACCLCLWLSWTSTASTRSSIETTTLRRSMSITPTTGIHHDAPTHHPILEYTSVESMMRNNDKFDTRFPGKLQSFRCFASGLGSGGNHHTSTTSSSVMRWTVPLQHAIHDPNKLIVGNFHDEITFQVCRRDCCVAGGECLDTKFVLVPATTPNTTTIIQERPCQTVSDISKSLQNGAWRQYTTPSTRHQGESWVSSECLLPTDYTNLLRPRNKSKNPQRLLFLGDSTMQELALLMARAAGSTKPNPLSPPNNNKQDNNMLNCTCLEATQVGTTKDCRTFDASSSSAFNVSMLWSGHTECNGNRMGIHVVDNDEWKRTISDKIYSMQPTLFLFPSAPVAFVYSHGRGMYPSIKEVHLFSHVLSGNDTSLDYIRCRHWSVAIPRTHRSSLSNSFTKLGSYNIYYHASSSTSCVHSRCIYSHGTIH